jgi:hypothetical protein
MNMNKTFPGGKVEQGRDTDYSPPYTAKVKNEESCSSPLVPYLVIVGRLYFMFNSMKQESFKKLIVCSFS